MLRNIFLKWTTALSRVITALIAWLTGLRITSVEPLTGWPGTIVTITGHGFSINRDENAVFIGSVRALVVEASENRVLALSGEMKVSGAVRLEVGADSATGGIFTVLPMPDPTDITGAAPPRSFHRARGRRHGMGERRDRADAACAWSARRFQSVAVVRGDDADHVGSYRTAGWRRVGGERPSGAIACGTLGRRGVGRRREHIAAPPDPGIGAFTDLADVTAHASGGCVLPGLLKVLKGTRVLETLQSHVGGFHRLPLAIGFWRTTAGPHEIDTALTTAASRRTRSSCGPSRFDDRMVTDRQVIPHNSD